MLFLLLLSLSSAQAAEKKSCTCTCVVKEEGNLGTASATAADREAAGEALKKSPGEKEVRNQPDLPGCGLHARLIISWRTSRLAPVRVGEAR